jgi:hypothetical protein
MWWYLFVFVASSIVSALLTPKPKGAEPSSLGEFQAPTAEEGRPISLFIGTCKIKGPNVTWWGALRAAAIKKKAGGFLGIGSKNVTIGYKYYLGMQMALASGTVDSLEDIVVGDKSLKANGAALPVAYSASGANVSINLPSLFGGDEKEGGLAGLLTFYFGSSAQTGDAYLASKFGGAAPGYRGVCHAILKDFYIGTSTYLKDWAWVLKCCPSPIGLNPAYKDISGDANPAYGLAYILTLDQELGGMGMSPSRIDTASFQACGSTLYSEGLGMSLLMDRCQSADAWMGEICRTVDAVCYTDPSTGLWTMKLTRADYDPDTLPEFTVADVVGAPEKTAPSWPETLNKILITYIDRAAGFVTATAQDQDAANRGVQGETNSSTIAYLGLSRAATAQAVAAREIRVHSYPTAGLKIVLNRKGWALRPGSPFKFTWAPLGITGMVFRVTNIRYGVIEDGGITIEAVEDIFSVTASIHVDPPPSGWVNPISAPVAVAAQMVLEVPYWVGGEARNVMALATEADQCYQAEVWTNEGAGYLHTSDMPAFTPSGLLTATYGQKTAALDATGFTLDTVAGMDRLASTNLDGLNRGDNIGIFADTGEVFGWTSITDHGDGTYTFAGILRGLLDTVPDDHSTGSRVYFMSDGAATTKQMNEGGGGGSSQSQWGLISGTLSNQSDLAAALSAKLSDAPSDGKQYARKNANWDEIASSGGASLYLALGPDIPPVAPDAWDDEFSADSGPSGTAAWSWMNQGSSTYAIQGGALMITGPAESPDTLRGLVKAFNGSGSWSITAKVSLQGNLHSGNGSGILLRNSSTGRILQLYLNAGTAQTIGFCRYSTYNAWASTIANMANVQFHKAYLRLSSNGTSIAAAYSLDGEIFTTIATEALSNYISSIDQVGFHVDHANASYSAEAVCSWIRRNWVPAASRSFIDSCSTVETATNKTWLNGEAIYRKVYVYSLTGSEIASPHGLDISKITYMGGIVRRTVVGQEMAFPIPWAGNAYPVGVIALVDNIITLGIAAWGTGTLYVTVEYTK